MRWGERRGAGREGRWVGSCTSGWRLRLLTLSSSARLLARGVRLGARCEHASRCAPCACASVWPPRWTAEGWGSCGARFPEMGMGVAACAAAARRRCRPRASTNGLLSPDNAHGRALALGVLRARRARGGAAALGRPSPSAAAPWRGAPSACGGGVGITGGPCGCVVVARPLAASPRRCQNKLCAAALQPPSAAHRLPGARTWWSAVGR